MKMSSVKISSSRITERKGRNLTQSCDKSPYTNRKKKKKVTFTAIVDGKLD